MPNWKKICNRHKSNYSFLEKKNVENTDAFSKSHI